MATNIVSPGVYIIEKDISEYAPSINSSVVALVGFANKGPLNKATLITSKAALVSTFGSPSEAITGQGLEAAVEILDDTQSLYYIRVSDGTDTAASANVSLGTCPGFMVSGQLDADVTAPKYGFGLTRGLRFHIQVTEHDGTLRPAFVVDVPVTGESGEPSQFQAIRNAFAPTAGTTGVSVYDDNLIPGEKNGYVVANFAGSGAYMDVHTYELAANGDEIGPINAIIVFDSEGKAEGGLVNPEVKSAARIYGSQFTLEENKNKGDGIGYNVVSLGTGAGYNYGSEPGGGVSGLSIKISPMKENKNWTLEILENGALTESFVQSFIDDATWLEDVIKPLGNDNSALVKAFIAKDGEDVDIEKMPNFVAKWEVKTGVEPVKASWKKVTHEWQGTETSAQATTTTYNSQTKYDARFVNLVPGEYGLVSGAAGVPGDDDAVADAVEGTTLADGTRTGIQALDNPSLNISMAAIPGITLEEPQNALVGMAEATSDFIAVLSPPYGIGGVGDAIEWSNGGEIRKSALDSSYAALYWPWVKVFDVFSGKDRWLDPAIFGIKAMCRTDSMAETWFAPAGFQRGTLTKPSEVEVVLNKGDRDSLYDGGAGRINPVVKFPAQGIVIFGQRTTHSLATALDRINVRRLMIYLKKVIFASTQRFVFEPNDEFTWARIQQVLIPMISEIKDRRGITDFRVVCDETTNTPTTIENNELWCKILIKPTKTAEMIVFELNLTNQSAQMGTL